MFKPMQPFWTRLLRAPEGEGAAGAGGDDAATAAAAASAAAAAAPAAKWWEGSDYAPDEQEWLKARGLTEDDALKALPKLVKGHRAAEQRIGKGLDAIMDRPAKDQPLAEWLRGNAATLGLPDKADGYAVTPPDTWPKDAKWDAGFEEAARKVAFDMGVPPEAHKAYVKMYAEKVAALEGESAAGAAKAKADMMAQLNHDFGDKTAVVMTRGKQAFQFLAEKAGFGEDQMLAASQSLMQAFGDPKTPGSGDANVIRLFAALADAMGEDSAVALGKGGALTDTPVEARAELAKLRAEGGEYYKAVAANDRAALDRLAPRIRHLSTLAG